MNDIGNVYEENKEMKKSGNREIACED